MLGVGCKNFWSKKINVHLSRPKKYSEDENDKEDDVIELASGVDQKSSA